MRNEFQRHKKSDGIKWVAVTLAVLLLAAAVMAAMTQGFKNWNPYGWFDKKEEQKDPEKELPPVDENGTAFVPDVVHSLPRNLIFRSAAATSESSNDVTLSATITPNDATNKAVDWTVAFVNPNSAWATGKSISSYVTVTPTVDGALTAKINCVAPFGEKIRITVTSRDNPEAKAECIVDYAKRISDLTVSLHKNSITGTVVSTATDASGLSIPFNDDSGRLFMAVSPIYSVGTISDNYVYQASCSTSPALDFHLSVTDFGGNTDYKSTVTYRDIDSISFSSGYLFLTQFTPMGYEDANGVYHPTSSTVLRAFYNRVANSNPNPLATFNFTATGKYSTFEKAVNIKFTPGTLTFAVENLTINNSTMVF